MTPQVRAVRVINDLSVAALSDGIMIELGAFYAGETRKLIMTFDVPGIPALGLAEVATLTFGYVTAARPGAADRHPAAARQRRPG